MWSKLPMATKETLGQPIISTEQPYEAKMNHFETVVYGPNTETGQPPFEDIVAFNQKHSLTNFDNIQLKTWFTAGAVFVVVKLGDKIVSLIISFPVTLTAQFDDDIKEFNSSYSTHLITDFSIRGHGVASLPITGLIKYGHSNSILSGYHQVLHPSEQMKHNMVPIEWWFRILNESRALKAGYKFPQGKTKHHYTAGLKLKPGTVAKPTYDQFNSLLSSCPADLKIMPCKHNYDILTQSLDSYYIPEHNVIFGLSYLQQTEYSGSSHKVKCAHLGLYIDHQKYGQRVETAEDVLKIIYSVALGSGCDLIYIPEISSINSRALDSTRAFKTTSPMYISWYNSGVTANSKKICLPVF